MSDKLNVLFLFADQMHAFCMGCMGSGDVDTPHLDRLAREGTLFRKCYTSNAVCTPYRAALMTGRYSSQTGFMNNHPDPLPPGEDFVADVLNRQGVRTSYVGKWHIGGAGNDGIEPHLRAGWTDFVGYQCYNDFVRDIWFFDEDGNKDVRTNHRTEATTDIAIERLDRIRDRQWVMAVSYQNPHYPVQPSERFADKYWDRPVTLRPNFQEIEGAFLAGGRAYPREDDPEWTLRGGEDTVSYIKMYNAMIEQLDEQVGRLLDYLDDTGQADNTVVIFTSDHGDMQGSHGLANKHVPYEESTHVPLVVRDPRTPMGSRGVASDQLVDTPDLTASIVDYAGCTPSTMHEGTSIKPFTRGEPANVGKAAFAEQFGYVMMVTQQYKLVCQRHSFKPTDLFDLNADPYEMTNLAASADHAVVREQLVTQLRAWWDDITSRENPNRLPDRTKGNPDRWWATKVPPA